MLHKTTKTDQLNQKKNSHCGEVREVTSGHD